MPPAPLSVRPLEDDDVAAWEDLVAAAQNATFLHSRRFLGYHGDRFEDHSLVVTDAKGAVVGLLPAARDLVVADRVVSHPGSTYGGLVHAGALRGEKTLQVLQDACEVYRAAGFRSFRYKTVPAMYHGNPVADDLYALFRLGADRYRADLAVTVDLDAVVPVRRNRRRNLEDAAQAGLRVVTGAEWLPAFWQVLTGNLMKKFGVSPAHTLAEVQDLCVRFPEQITCHAVVDGDDLVAGLVNFHTPRVLHCQYSAASSRGFAMNALDLGFAWSIADARERGNRYFDFGVCNEQEGRVLNSSLYDFKISFGAGSTLHEFFEIAL